MSLKRSRPGDPAVRHGKAVGPDYPEDRYVNPVGAGLDHTFNGTEAADKTICSPSGTTFSPNIPMNKKYGAYWEEK